MDDVDPAYREIIDRLRSGGHFSSPPPLPPESKGGKSGPVDDGLERRVSRLEVAFCAAVVLIFSAIIASYLLLSPRIEATTVAVAELRGDIKVLNERSETDSKRLERIESKLDGLVSKK